MIALAVRRVSDATNNLSSMSQHLEKEFIFIDESGDPGPAGNETYILIALHTNETTLDRIRKHVVAFRYHHDVTKEFKDQRWTDKLPAGGPAAHLLTFMAELTDDGHITTTGVWLHKATYKAGRGPYLTGASGDSWRFRNYQLRRLLEHHVVRRRWHEAVDLVIDRWAMTLEQRKNLEDYLRGNFTLRPVIPWITLVDSAYCDPIQVVDIYSRLARRVVTGTATADEVALCTRLVALNEIRGGLY